MKHSREAVSDIDGYAQEKENMNMGAGKINSKIKLILVPLLISLLVFCGAGLFLYFTFYDATPTNPCIVNSSPAVVCLVDDDGSKNFYTELQPILEKFDMPCTLAVVTDVVSGGGELNWSDLNSLKLEGYDIVSHSDNHSVSKWGFYRRKIWKNIGLSKKAIESSANNSYVALKQNLMDTNIIVYPYGSYGKLFREACDTNYDFGITTEEEVMRAGEKVDGLALPRIFITNLHSVEDYYEYIDQAVENKGLLILGIHSSIPDEWSPKTVELIFEYIETKNIEFCTLSEAIERKLDKVN